MQEYVGLGLGLLSLLGVLVGVFAQRRGQREETHLETSKWIKQDLRLDYERLRAEFEMIRDELTAARLEIVALERETRRLQDVPGFDTMKRFCDDWLALLNSDVANPAGLAVEVYTDDVDQKVALGHRTWLKGHAPPDSIPALGLIDAKRDRLQELVTELQGGGDAVTDVTDEPLGAEGADE